MDSFDAVEERFVIRVDSLVDILSSFLLVVIEAVRGAAAVLVLVLAVPVVVDMLARVLWCCFIDLCDG